MNELPQAPSGELPLNAPADPRVTTVEESAWKASVEPYHPVPVMDVPQGVIACAFCANTRFRRSRPRLQDVLELLLLRFPLRCMRCNQRQYGLFLTAGIALAPKTHGPRLARGKETWKAWTEQGMNGQPLPKPMSTAIGTRATRIQRLPKAQAGQGKIRNQPWKDDDRQIW